MGIWRQGICKPSGFECSRISQNVTDRYQKKMQRWSGKPISKKRSTIAGKKPSISNLNETFDNIKAQRLNVHSKSWNWQNNQTDDCHTGTPRRLPNPQPPPPCDVGADSRGIKPHQIQLCRLFKYAHSIVQTPHPEKRRSFSHAPQLVWKYKRNSIFWTKILPREAKRRPMSSAAATWFGRRGKNIQVAKYLKSSLALFFLALSILIFMFQVCLSIKHTSKTEPWIFWTDHRCVPEITHHDGLPGKPLLCAGVWGEGWFIEVPRKQICSWWLWKGAPPGGGGGWRRGQRHPQSKGSDERLT